MNMFNNIHEPKIDPSLKKVFQSYLVIMNQYPIYKICL